MIKKTNKICKKCGNLVKGRKRKFCSFNCFREHKKEYIKEWIKNNRSHFNDLCREKSKLYMRKRYIEAKQKGLCTGCLKKPVYMNRVRCKSCLDYYNKYRMEKRNE